jgi:predicted site-specific integrase-resolvase
VTFAVRLTRFGHAYLGTLFTGLDMTLTVPRPAEENQPEQELTEALFAIIASFASRLS